MNTVNVELAERSYPIFVGAGLLEQLESLLGGYLKGRSVFLVTDSNLEKLYLERAAEKLSAVSHSVHTCVFPAGEASKQLSTIETICREGVRAGLDRKSVFVALGGGVCGDMTGFSAAIYMRGTRFIQLPTTLLAMVDSSVGGKTGVDLPEGKNLIGAFFQPEAVVIDTDFLKTLSARELSCGYAELIKTAVILDGALFDTLEKHAYDLLALADAERVSGAISRCCALKAQVVSADEKESSLRAILNYGHTFGHAIESVTGYSLIEHGEGVAIGMCIAAELAVSLGLISNETAARQEALLKAFALPVQIPAGYSAEAIFKAMGSDKKNSGGRLKLILPEKIGKAGIYTDVPVEKIMNAINQRIGK